MSCGNLLRNYGLVKAIKPSYEQSLRHWTFETKEGLLQEATTSLVNCHCDVVSNNKTPLYCLISVFMVQLINETELPGDCQMW